MKPFMTCTKSMIRMVMSNPWHVHTVFIKNSNLKAYCSISFLFDLENFANPIPSFDLKHSHMENILSIRICSQAVFYDIYRNI